MAIIVALVSKIQNLFSSYVLSVGDSSGGSLVSNPYSMPLLYVIVIAIVIFIGYFCWQSYRQEIHEEKLQQRNESKEEKHSSFNLTWVNKLVNWVNISAPSKVPEAVERWIEDINITLAKNKSQIKVLIYGLREGSLSPWLREVGNVERKEGYVEVPVKLEAPEFGFTVSVQEENNGRVIASTYAAVVTQFHCWYTAILSRIDGSVLLKLEAKTNGPRTVHLKMKSLSDQKVESTVPEVIADLIKSSVLRTPFYLNVSTWGPVIPATPVSVKTSDDNGNTIQSRNRGNDSGGDAATRGSAADAREIGDLPPAETAENQIHVESNIVPLDTTGGPSDHLKSANKVQGLSGSLGSLVGIKRTPSGRGPAKPIRSREKQLVMQVEKLTGLEAEESHYCRATLDYPPQKFETKPSKITSEAVWSQERLTFDLSSRSSEVKLVVYRHVVDGQQDSPIASTVLRLDRINIEQPSQQVMQLKTMNKETAFLTLQLAFAENPVDASVLRTHSNSRHNYSSPRRSLDISLIASQLPPMVDEKGDAKSVVSSSLSCVSSDSTSAERSPNNCTTVTTTTRRKITPVRDSNEGSIPISHSSPNMQMPKTTGPQSDISLVNGTVADIAMTALSKQAKITEQSPELKSRIKKGKVTITSVTKSPVVEVSDNDVTPLIVNDTPEEDRVAEKKPNDEMYYSMCSLTNPAEVKPVGEDDGTNEIKLNRKQDEPEDAETLPKQPTPDIGTKPKKQRRKRDKRPKSMVAGMQRENIPPGEDEKEWPKVRRSRSLVFGKGKKKQYKTGSATDLNKKENAKEDVYPEGYDEDSPVTVPENDLQKHSKKKKSKSITKLISKLGRKPSMKKSKKEADIMEDNENASSPKKGGTSPSPSSTSSVPDRATNGDDTGTPGSRRPNIASTESESESLVSEATGPSIRSPSLSNSSSQMDENHSVKRSKSLRKRLFGGKRKTAKN